MAKPGAPLEPITESKEYKELVSTEETFVNTINNFFIEYNRLSPKEKKAFDQKDSIKLLEDVLMKHLNLYLRLKNGDIDKINDQIEQLDELYKKMSALNPTPTFSKKGDLIAKKLASAMNNLTVSSIFILPIQRPPRYVMLSNLLLEKAPEEEKGKFQKFQELTKRVAQSTQDSYDIVLGKQAVAKFNSYLKEKKRNKSSIKDELFRLGPADVRAILKECNFPGKIDIVKEMIGDAEKKELLVVLFNSYLETLKGTPEQQMNESLMAELSKLKNPSNLEEILKKCDFPTDKIAIVKQMIKDPTKDPALSKVLNEYIKANQPTVTPVTTPPAQSPQTGIMSEKTPPKPLPRVHRETMGSRPPSRPPPLPPLPNAPPRRPLPSIPEATASRPLPPLPKVPQATMGSQPQQQPKPLPKRPTDESPPPVLNLLPLEKIHQMEKTRKLSQGQDNKSKQVVDKGPERKTSKPGPG